MSFSYDLSTDAGKLRLKIADTGGASNGATSATGGYAFEDEELAIFLTDGGSVTGAARLALQTLIVDAARRERAFKVPGLDYDDKGRVSALKTALGTLGADLPTLTISGPTVHPFDTAYINPITGA